MTILLVASMLSSPGIDHGHQAWTDILVRNVKDGEVSYKDLKTDAALDRYLKALAAVNRDAYGSFSREQKLAYWINAYNAFTIQLILDNYPLKSIRQIGLLPGAAFREEFIPIHVTDEDDISLNHIEHEIIRKKFAEPRIHFALVCASESCPSLRSEAFRAEALEKQLDDQARTFLNDTSKNRFDAKSKTLYLSSIFKWFDDDFEKSAGSVTAYVARYLGDKVRDAKVEFLDYDWALNGK